MNTEQLLSTQNGSGLLQHRSLPLGVVDADQIHRLHLEPEARVVDDHTVDTLFAEAAAQQGDAAALFSDLEEDCRPDAASPQFWHRCRSPPTESPSSTGSLTTCRTPSTA